MEDGVYYRRVLHELIELGSELARLVVGEARARVAVAAADDGAARADVNGAAEAFERVSRAVRRTVRMAQFVAEPVGSGGRSVAAQRVTNRRRVLRGVEDMIQREVGGEAAERLHAELLERLEGPDLDDELLDRPLDEVIRMVRCDLGLPALMGSRDWVRRTPADVARLQQRATDAAAGGAGLPDGRRDETRAEHRGGPGLDGLSGAALGAAARRSMRAVPTACGP